MKSIFKFSLALLLFSFCVICSIVGYTIFENNNKLRILGLRATLVEASLLERLELLSTYSDVSRNSGSGVYCMFELENTYAYTGLDIDNVIRKINSMQLKDIDVRSDGASLKIHAYKKKEQLKVYFESGPWNGYLDPRCYS